jgi:mannose-6-phosphate isomerase-like protein (cupin superfamily)
MVKEERMTIETREGVPAYVLQPGEGQSIENLRLRIVATGALTGGTLCAATCVNPGPGGPPLHTHHAHDELYFVLQGCYRFKIGEEESEGGPGTFAYAPRGTTHTFASVGPEEGRMFFVCLPGLEHFLEGISDLAANGVGQEDMAALFHEYQSEVNGPPLL